VILIVKHQDISKIVVKVSKNWSKPVSYANVNILPRIDILWDRLKIIKICNTINLIKKHELNHLQTIYKLRKARLDKGKV
jgi:hypothetical protein